jgi:3-oxoacyl-[acyl-carrier protein] reductase
MELSFKGKTVFITGASGGIGSVISSSFKKDGAIVIEPGPDEMDLTDIDGVSRYCSKLEDPVDIVVLCAGINEKQDIEHVSFGCLDKTFKVNLFSSIEIIKAFAPKMKKRKAGHIVFISSLYSMVSKEGRIPYASSKAAISGLMKTLALELAPSNVMVNAIAPGYVMTPMTTKNLTEKEISDIEELIPTHRFQSTEDIASLVLFLSSDLNESITGQLIAVDGGFLCR